MLYDKNNKIDRIWLKIVKGELAIAWIIFLIVIVIPLIGSLLMLLFLSL